MDFLLVIAALMAANLASVAVVGGIVYALRSKIKANIEASFGALVAQASQAIGHNKLTPMISSSSLNNEGN